MKQLVGDIRVGQREFATYNMRLAAEGISAKDGEVKRDTYGPDGGRLGLVEARQDPLGRHAFESALKFAERLAAQPKVSGRAEVDYFYGVVL